MFEDLFGELLLGALEGAAEVVGGVTEVAFDIGGSFVEGVGDLFGGGQKPDENKTAEELDKAAEELKRAAGPPGGPIR
ncbi:MAG TPA: hypothetical protein VEQ42_13900 [Pyrinomonadaceae bacterium]|nr:hypothetical protein [Pyrinomonadaceae bacterium]